MRNQPVEVQFWLDIGSQAWSERLYQPLTHPYVLSREWLPGRLWTDADELEAGRAALERLVNGLVSRCRSALYLGLSDLNEQGYEQRGALLRALQRLRIRRLGPPRDAAPHPPSPGAAGGLCGGPGGAPAAAL